MAEKKEDMYSDGTPSDWPMMYDISTDEMRPVTQKDWDDVMAVITAYGQRREALKIPPDNAPLGQKWGFQLALYPNPMRPGECYVCESKDIPPEPLMEYHGRPLYAPYPETPWILPSIIPLNFAIEIVRRWNRPQGPSSI